LLVRHGENSQTCLRWHDIRHAVKYFIFMKLATCHLYRFMNLLIVPGGYLHSYQHVADFVHGAVAPHTLVLTGALGHTEDALRTISRNFMAGDKENALRLFEQVKQQHTSLAKYLLVVQYFDAIRQMQDLFTEVEWLLHDSPVRGAAYYEQQILCLGPLLCSVLVWASFREQKQPATWTDIRDLVRTTNTFAQPQLETPATHQALTAWFAQQHPLAVSQLGVGSTSDNESTTYDLAALTSWLALHLPAIRVQVL
jgi:aspartate kinase